MKIFSRAGSRQVTTKAPGQALLNQAGVSRRLFDQVFWGAFTRVAELGDWSEAQKTEAMEDLERALHKRRGLILPVGIAEEEIHGQKDRWTFIVYLAGLHSLWRRFEGGFSLPFILKDALPEPAWKWIYGDPDVFGVLMAGLTGSGTCATSRAVAGLFGGGETQPCPEAAMSAPIGAVLTEEDEVLESGSGDASQSREEKARVGLAPSKRQLGIEFVRWVAQQEEVRWLKVEGGVFIVDTPQAFQAFGKDFGCSWKAAQAGVMKLKIHELGEDQKPFIMENGRSVMRLHISHTETGG